MALKFEFTVSDEDGYNILEQIRKTEVDTLLTIMETTDEATKAWFRSHLQYWKALYLTVVKGVSKV